MNEQQNYNYVVVLKMVNGENIIGKFINDKSTSDYVVIDKPLKLHTARDIDENTGESRHLSYFHMWNTLTEETEFYIPYLHIITMNFAAKSIQKFFDKNVDMFYDGIESEQPNDESGNFESSEDSEEVHTMDLSEDDAWDFLLRNFSANNATTH